MVEPWTSPAALVTMRLGLALRMNLHSIQGDRFIHVR